MDYSDPSYVAWVVQHPATTGDVLAQIAQKFPSLRSQVAAHPNAQPQLVAWIAAQSPTPPQAAVPQPPVIQPPVIQPAVMQSPVPSVVPQNAVPLNAAPPTVVPPQVAVPQNVVPHNVVPQTAVPQTAAPQQHPSPQPQYGQMPSQAVPASAAPAQPRPTPAGRQYYVPSDVAAAPKKTPKKTGAVFGLLGGAVVVVAIVAAMGVFVFGWFGAGDSAPPVLTKTQAEKFINSAYMQEFTGGIKVKDYTYQFADPADLDGWDVPDGCEDLISMQVGSHSWSSGQYSVGRYSGVYSPKRLIDAKAKCSLYGPETWEGFRVRDYDGGWWMRDKVAEGVTMVYGNVWLRYPGTATDDEIKEQFKDFRAAVISSAQDPGSHIQA